MKAPESRKQRTFYVGEKKIRIVSSRITRKGLSCGWRVYVNGVKYEFFDLKYSRAYSERKDVEKFAYARWIDDMEEVRYMVKKHSR